MDEALGTLRPLMKLKAAPEMVRIDRHREALPLYHGAYQARMRAITARLQHIPGLYLEANYRGGVSVRDRLACGHAVGETYSGSAALASCRAQGPRRSREAGRDGGRFAVR